MNKLILIGGGGHCKSVIDVVEMMNEWEIIGILDKKEKVGKKVLNYEIIGTDKDIPNFAKKGYYFLLTVGHVKSFPSIRINLFDRVKTYTDKIATIISPLAYVSKYAKLGKGTIVMHHAIVNAGAKIGNNCIINTKALIEHDAVIEDNCHISTGAIVNGGTIVRKNTFLGSNSVTKEYIEINRCFVKAGEVVK